MKNPESHKALMDNTLLHGIVADFPKAIKIPSDYVKATEGGKPDSVEQHLTPPYGTRGFINQVYSVEGTNWILDLYGYRHANSNNVTVIIVHSGTVSSENIIWPVTVFRIWTTPATIHKFQYPETYEEDLGDSRYSSLTTRNTINMIGPDGRNPVPFEIVYRETFVSYRIDSPDPVYLKFTQVKLVQSPWITGMPGGTFTGRIEVVV
ncbi:hypothetical protein BDP27DRAFT_1331905 [Rhodocollybia butyracea]|uniref:Uncharacterized protein n=1 Tax=Rhodocollybia butyracea TaxID=206335 RepID=A0A9P5PLE4_9AGAR|nr:hypothetical protein BDP27DRAFT_1331905 [Rhodocollybia butyracea]